MSDEEQPEFCACGRRWHTPDWDHVRPLPMERPVLSVQARRLNIVALVYREWAAEQDAVEAVGEDEAEGAVAMNAGHFADADLDARIRAALAVAGIPFPGDGGA